MSRQLRLEHEGAIWHVTSRGNERREIFRDRNDRSTFIDFLAKAVIDARWRLHAYVLMDNHYHLLIETPERTLSRGAKWLNETWAQHFNWRHDRVGHLFQGRFKGILVERETHLLELVRYIVLNPVRCGAVAYAADYEWSNYRATAGLEPVPDWLEVEWTLNQFHADRRIAIDMYRGFVANARGAAYCPWESLVGEIYLGGRKFQEDLQRRVDALRPSNEIPTAQRRVVQLRFESVMTAVCLEFGETPESLRQKNRRVGRKVVAHLARECCSMTFGEIAFLLGSTDRAAARLAVAGAEMERSNDVLRRAIERARKRVKYDFQV
jgi:REP element-mobilizing transposase RayT